MVVFIVVPKNKGLQVYREKALSSLQGVDPSRIIEVRGEDVPFWVEELQGRGKKVVGLTGEDLFNEYLLDKRKNSVTIIDKISWEDPKAKFGKPALCLLGPQDNSFENMPKTLTVCISSKYKKLGRKYLNFLEQQGYTFKKIYVMGCVEVSCKEGIADLVIDIVYTGNSLEKFGLSVYDIISQSNFVILGNVNENILEVLK
tara:strand:- start:56 stop:658 length:603 start_codon:yes stop_codon:yes gene_type:complete